MLNRLGAAIPNGMIFALKSDTVGGSGKQLRADKRPRPIVLRANVGDCLTITLHKLHTDKQLQRSTCSGCTTGTTPRCLSTFRAWSGSQDQDDGSFVGKNNSSLVSAAPVPAYMPPQTQTYTLFAKAEGTFLLYTMGDTSSNGNQLTRGLFGAVNVQPAERNGIAVR